jgi:RNA polymerase sigma-70 factor (ECF subfamily)
MDSDDRMLRDEMLRREVLAGSEQAWRIWYGETFDELYRYVLWRCGGRRDWADEVVQETWLHAVRRVRRFAPGKGSFSAWVRGIASNVLCNHFRRQKKIGNNARHVEDAIDNKPAASQIGSDNKNHEQVAAVLAALNQRNEAVLRAKYFDGLSVERIAADWNTTQKAVESLLSRAREEFRELYKKTLEKLA